MSDNQKLNQEIDQYMLENPRQDGEEGYYKYVGGKFNVHPEKVRKRWRVLRDKNKVQTVNYLQVVNPTVTLGDSQPSTGTTITTTKWNGDTGFYEVKDTEQKIETLEDLVNYAEIDTEKYDIIGHEIKSYNAWIKNKAGEIENKKLFSVKATLEIKKVGNIHTDKRVLLDEIKKYAAETRNNTRYELAPIVTLNLETRQLKNHALEINIPDLHIGKLAWAKEGGEDYDIKIACDRYRKAVHELVARVNPHVIEKIILPVGNDLLQADNAASTTTAGTRVDTDSRFGKMFQAAKNLLIETIDFLATVAPVHIEIIPGNHDTIATFTLGEVLDAWYHGDERVTVSNTHAPRKYVVYGQNLVMYTHGHREKLNDLGIICATEQPQLWAATKYRRVHVGHFHHSKQVKFTDVQEYPGFTVKILNSLSANDAWHAEKGYQSLKGAEAFLYDKDKGLVANYFYLHN